MRSAGTNQYDAAQRSSDYRSGITLLETLIAMMVMAIGLLGLASLLPVGKWEMARANQADRAGAAGRSGFRDLAVRGVFYPQNWIYLNGQNPAAVLSTTLDPTTHQTTFSAGLTTPTASGAAYFPYMPIVIDPLMIAFNSVNGLPNTALVAKFPYTASVSGAPMLPRITLAAVPGSTLAMGMGAAEAMCRPNDDLVFTLPHGGKSRPLGSFLFTPATSVSAADVSPGKRLSNGDISWFATITPDVLQAAGAPVTIPTIPGIYNPAGAPPVAMGGATNVRQYLVSVAACFRRELTSLSGGIPAGTPAERMASVAFVSALPGGGGGAGTSTSFSTSEAFISIPTISDQKQADDYLSVQPEQWIMILGSTKNYAANPAGTPQVVMNWYRIVGAGASVDHYTGVTGLAPGNWARPLRLDGPDWDNSWSQAGPPVAYIVNGVYGVFQKTMFSDGISSWSL